MGDDSSDDSVDHNKAAEALQKKNPVTRDAKNKMVHKDSGNDFESINDSFLNQSH
tara:strand:- start:198 stop:362 length:165 start_codon:yes stop_codon:yes gene_type:complete